MQTSRPASKFDLTSSAISQAITRTCSVVVACRSVLPANEELASDRAEIA